MSKDYYKALGVEKGASEEEIKKAQPSPTPDRIKLEF